MSVSGKQIPLFLIVAVLLFSTVATLFFQQSASAAQITPRSLTLVAGPTDGGSKPSGVVHHRFTFTAPGTTSLGSIKLAYCTTASGTCTMPTGLVTTSATLGSQSGGNTGFTLNNTTNGAPYLTRTAVAGAGTASTYQINTITNPSTVGSFFVRVTTYSSIDVTTGSTDTGTVTASTAEPIVLTGTMPESLIFCTGATVNANCTTTTPGTISFNQLFSPTDTATATSQMAASTNASSGYSITVNGSTLSAGGPSIPAMASATTGTKGTGQFGMNLRLNTTATSTIAVGADITPTSDGADYRGQALAGYNTVDTFKFVSGDAVANSAFSAAGPTNSQVYTASYIVNVAGNQLAGTYTTTLTYICTPTF